MRYDEIEDCYVCAQGRKLSLRREVSQTTAEGYVKTTAYYSCDDCSARWLRFKDQAVLVGLVSAGVLALGAGAHRRITVPAAATVGVAALALTATGLIAPLFGADLFPAPSDTAANVEEQSAAAPREATPTPDAATNVAADGPLAAPAGRPRCAARRHARCHPRRSPSPSHAEHRQWTHRFASCRRSRRE